MPSADYEYPVWNRLVRFVAEDDQEYCGQPVDYELDIGLAMLRKQPVDVRILSGSSCLDLEIEFTGETKRAVEILTPISAQETGAIVCIGLNYTDHAAEMKAPIPKYPEVFLKPQSSISSPTAPIVIPSICSNQADGEVELAIVISKDCKNCTLSNAMEHVLGYMTANDVTAREIQKYGSQWGYSKGFDTFCPLGPVIVSKKAIPNPKVLSLKTTLNGKVMQDGKAANMIFSIEEILVFLSAGHTLRKGTVVLTGTPSGIGASHNPPVYLAEGADLKVWISHGLGTLVNPIVQE